MKKILIIASLFFSLSAFGQYNRAGLLFSTSLGFSKTQDFSENIFFGGNNNNNFSPPENISKTFSIAPEFSYVASEKFMIGFGYLSTTLEDFFSQSFNSTDKNGLPIVQTSTSNFKSMVSGPTLHLRYSQNIVSKLIVSLKFTYFNLKGIIDTEFTDSNISNFNTKNTINYNVGEARFSPSLHYFISQKFGCYVETEGLKLNLNDSRKLNKSIDYNFNLTPQNWRIGIFYFIPTKKAVE
jgi:hypothetical protein